MLCYHSLIMFTLEWKINMFFRVCVYIYGLQSLPVWKQRKKWLWEISALNFCTTVLSENVSRMQTVIYNIWY